MARGATLTQISRRHHGHVDAVKTNEPLRDSPNVTRRPSPWRRLIAFSWDAVFVVLGRSWRRVTLARFSPRTRLTDRHCPGTRPASFQPDRARPAAPNA